MNTLVLSFATGGEFRCWYLVSILLYSFVDGHERDNSSPTITFISFLNIQLEVSISTSSAYFNFAMTSVDVNVVPPAGTGIQACYDVLRNRRLENLWHSPRCW